MKGDFMRLVIVILLVLMATVVMAGEREELQWKARALIAEANLAQTQVQKAQTAIQDLLKEVDARGYVIDQNGNVIVKPESKGEKK